jgi:hypothetical protein
METKMKIIHNLLNRKIERESGSSDASLLVTNNLGGYAWISDKVRSRYQGVFFREDNKIFRVIESVEGMDDAEELVNEFYQAGFQGRGKGINYFMPDMMNSVVIEPKNCDSRIYLDFKESYNNQDYASYDFKNEKNNLVVKILYKGQEYYLVGKFSSGFLIEQAQTGREYEHDRARNSQPWQRNATSVCRANASKIVFSFSKSLENAIHEAEIVFGNSEGLKREKENRINSIVKKIGGDEIFFAYNSCRISLDALSLEEGLFAGFPWFFQFWARDELISLKALSSVNKELAKKITTRWLENLDDFTMTSKYSLDLEPSGTSVDAVGWLIKRLGLFKFPKNLNLDCFILSLNEEMIRSGNQETWMDSLSRAGHNIEMQAMKLYALRMAYKLTGEARFHISETLLRKEVREGFFVNEMLVDSLERREIRPNLFIAYYFYPELLSGKEWEACFDKALSLLWNDWGGFSTIEKGSGLYHNDYSGENGPSYHDGDSWFWINNLAGLCMHKLNKVKYKAYIDKIMGSSGEEILWNGAIGHHAEISSSSHLHSAGCVAQAFSAGMFIEMVDEMIK